MMIKKEKKRRKSITFNMAVYREIFIHNVTLGQFFISVYVLGLFLFLSQKGKLPADVTTEEDILEKYYMYAAMATCLQNG